MRSMRSFQSTRSAIGLADLEKKAARAIGLEKGDAPVRPLPREACHRPEAGVAQRSDRAVGIFDGERKMIQAYALAHHATREVGILRVLEQLDGHILGPELGDAQADVGQVLALRFAEEHAEPCDCGVEVGDDDADMIYACHALLLSSAVRFASMAGGVPSIQTP